MDKHTLLILHLSSFKCKLYYIHTYVTNLFWTLIIRSVQVLLINVSTTNICQIHPYYLLILRVSFNFNGKRSLTCISCLFAHLELSDGEYGRRHLAFVISRLCLV